MFFRTCHSLLLSAVLVAGFFVPASFAQDTVPIQTETGNAVWGCKGVSSHPSYCQNVPGTFVGFYTSGSHRNQLLGVSSCSLVVSNYQGYTAYGCSGGTGEYNIAFTKSNFTLEACPTSHPVNNGDGTCSLAPPESPDDCPIGTEPRNTTGSIIGDGTLSCQHITCPTGPTSVSMPSALFDSVSGGLAAGYCDGRCATQITFSPTGAVTAWSLGKSCGNGNKAQYEYVLPSFDDPACVTISENVIDCSNSPNADFDGDPLPDITPDDLDSPLEQLTPPSLTPLPDCTAETAISGGCFVNTMDAYQSNQLATTSYETRNQTNELKTIIAAQTEVQRDTIVNNNRAVVDAINRQTDLLTAPITESPDFEYEDATLQDVADMFDEDISGVDFDNLIPKATKTLGFNPTDYQFGVGGGLCPAPTSMVIGGQTITFSWQMFCDFALIINAFLIALAYWWGTLLIFRSM